jgi:TRAP transporter TAXI family solute receptor
MALRLVSIGTALAVLAGPSSAQVLSIATNPQGSQFFSSGAAIAKLMQDTLGVQVRVQPMGGPTVFMPLIERGEVEFAIAAADDVDTAFRGVEAYDGKPNPKLRLVAAMFPLVVGIAVPANSPAKKIADLKGMTIAAGYANQTTLRKVQEAILATAGLKGGDLVEVPVVNVIQASEALAKGRVEAALANPFVAQTQQAHVTLESRGGLRFLPIDAAPQAVAAMRKILPSRLMTLQPGRIVGVAAPTPVMAYSTFLVASERIDPALIERLAKALHDNKDKLEASAPVLAGFQPARMAEPFGVPYHPGAEKFYRAAGQWPPRE